MYKIILTGFMGSGKSTVARCIATKLAIMCYEMDEHIVRKTGYAHMGALFQSQGELFLREHEVMMSVEWSLLKTGVISCGGGIVLNKICLDYLKMQNGRVFFLDAPYDVLKNRIATDGTVRPLFQDEAKAQKLFALRQPLYQAYADHRVDVSEVSVSEVADNIIDYISSI